MKKNDKKEVRTKTLEELESALKDAKEVLFTMQIDLSRQKLKNTRSLFLKRKEIAFLKTLITEKELLYASH